MILVLVSLLELSLTFTPFSLLTIAPIGIAMGLNGTDIAKDSADLILVDDKFDSIVNGIREGRTIFDNIQKFIIALLVANVGEVILLLIGLAFRDGNNDSVFPLSPIQSELST